MRPRGSGDFVDRHAKTVASVADWRMSRNRLRLSGRGDIGVACKNRATACPAVAMTPRERRLALMRKVLVADDDSHIRDVISFALRREGFTVVEVADGDAALAAFEREAPDLLVLDVMMPGRDGLEVCRAVRSGGHAATRSNVPIVFLSAKDAELDRVLGLEVGGDDYVVKPFSVRELVARVKAFFRRLETFVDPAQKEIVAGPLRMDVDAWTVTVEDRAVVLTRTEFGLLATLAQFGGKVLNRETLMNGSYPGHRIVSDRTIDSHMRRLRGKLRQAGLDAIQTIHGVGFRLNVPTAAGDKE